MNLRRSLPCLLMTSLLLAALLPLGSVSATPTEPAEFYYGVEYDWSSVDTDLENFTGLDVPEILGEVMGAADDAGFNLVVGQLQTGASNVYVHHTEDITPQTIQDNNGNDVSVWSRTDDVTLRHGVLADSILQTDWSESTFGSDTTSFDIDVVQTLEQVLTVDMTYTEYLDDTYNLVGADMEFSMDVEATIGLNIDALFEGGGDEFPIDFDTELDLGYSISESSSQWRLGAPNSVYVDLSAANDNYYWECGESECGDLTGDYTGAVDYSFSIEGIPTEDFGLDAGEFDLEISDSLTDSGTFDMEMYGEFDFSKGDTLTVDLGDGEGMSTQVQSCETCPPGNPLMFMMMGYVLAGSGEDFAEQIAEELDEDLTEAIESVFGIDEENSDGGLTRYSFYGEDTSGDNLGRITMNQGTEEINWDSVMVQVSVDGDAPVTCTNPGMSSVGDCSLVEFGSTGDQVWSVGDGVTVMDDADMCPEGDYCTLEYHISDISEGKILDRFMLYVEGFSPADAPPRLSGDIHFWGDNVTIQTELHAQNPVFMTDDPANFTCDDGTTIEWTQINDGNNDCSAGEEEGDWSSEKVFTCDDGTEIPWPQVNDYTSNCAMGEDEGIQHHYTLQMTLYDGDNTPLSSVELTICENGQAYTCDDDPTWGTSWSEDSGVSVPSAYGDSTMCLTATLSNTRTSSPLVEMTETCHTQWVGPAISYVDMWEENSMELYYELAVYDYSQEAGASVEYTINDPNQNEIESGTMAIDGSQSSYRVSATQEFLEPGEYCLSALLYQDGISMPYQEMTSCAMLEESDEEISERVETVFGALIDSGLEDVLENFGMNLEERLETIEPFEEFPYDNGMWAPMWSNEHAAMVGVGVYVMNDDGAYTLAGPQTEGYMDAAPAKLSIRYLTGVEANTANNGMEEATTISDIVDVEDHNLDDIEQDLIEAGIDTSDLTLPATDDTTNTDGTTGDDNPSDQTAEELAEESGLDLPFLSPVSMIAVIVLAGVVAGSRRDFDSEDGEE